MDENSVLYLEQCRYTEHSVYVAIQNGQKYSTISALFWDIMQHLVVYSLRTFRENLSAPSSRAKKSKKIRCPETSVRNNNPEERVSLRRKPKMHERCLEQHRFVFKCVVSVELDVLNKYQNICNSGWNAMLCSYFEFVGLFNIFFLNFPENRNVCVTTGGVYRNRHR